MSSSPRADTTCPAGRTETIWWRSRCRDGLPHENLVGPAAKPELCYLRLQRSRSVRIRRRLIHLVLVAALPAALLSAAVAWFAYRDQLATFQTQLRETTRAVMFSVDRELGEGLALGRGLASSPHFDGHALDLFHKQVLSAVPDADHWVVVHDVPAGRQLINTKLPFGAVLPLWDNAEEWVRDCASTR